jgi:hypothetical protein
LEVKKVRSKLKRAGITLIQSALAVLLGSTASIGPAAPAAQAAVSRPHCQVCGRYTDKSPSHVQASFKVKKHSETVDTCSLLCYAERREDFADEPLNLLISGYQPKNSTDPPLWLSAKRAYYLYEAEGDSQKCSEPFIYAFRSKDEAVQASKQLGGTVLEWPEVIERCTKLAADYEPPVADDHRSGREGRNPH